MSIRAKLLFKRWKSLLGLSKLRGKQMSELSWSWVYGKLLYCLLIEHRGGRRLGEESPLAQREQSLWRLWKLVKEEVAVMISGRLYWQESNWQKALSVLGERKHKRGLQSLPDEVLKFLNLDFGKPQDVLGVAC